MRGGTLPEKRLRPAMVPQGEGKAPRVIAIRQEKTEPKLRQKEKKNKTERGRSP